ncbi:MAG: hydrogenase maturation protease [Candidatus Dormibacteria bacterium]
MAGPADAASVAEGPAGRAAAGQQRVVVIGVGNVMRRDDGAGIAAVERARPLLPAGVEVRTLRGEATALLDAWEGAGLAVVVDAVRWEHPPVSGVTRIDVISDPDALTGFGAAASSHGLGVAEAIALGRVLDRLPSRLVLLLITLTEEGHGEGLSPAVEGSVGEAVALMVAEVSGFPSSRAKWLLRRAQPTQGAAQ